MKDLLSKLWFQVIIGIPLILGVDRILDMRRITINIIYL